MATRLERGISFLAQSWKAWACRSPNVAIIHEFQKPPYGGGNQFLLALEGELSRRGVAHLRNSMNDQTFAVLFNSFNFDFDRLRSLKNRFPRARFVHRIDGPISVYRGKDFQVDQKIFELNLEVADFSIFQSRYSLEKTQELGLKFKPAAVIHNAVDSAIFFRGPGVPSRAPGRKTRLIATSWSEHPNKGGSFYAALDQKLDWSRYEMTFVGRTPIAFQNIRRLEPVGSERLGQILREHDVYVMASRNDSCSNALLEALSCGLPAVYHSSGGSPELVGKGGQGFTDEEGLLKAIESVSAEVEKFQSFIQVEPLSAVAQSYLEKMKGAVV